MGNILHICNSNNLIGTCLYNNQNDTIHLVMTCQSAVTTRYKTIWRISILCNVYEAVCYK